MRPSLSNPLHDLGQGVDPDTFVARSSVSVIAAPPIARSREERAREMANFRFRDLTIRALNTLIASLLLVVSLPIMVLIALAVRLTSEGPVIFAQDRVGIDARRAARRSAHSRFGMDRRMADRGGRIFKIYKFRTMCVTGSEAPQVWAGKDDPRVTGVGRILRAHRLDELPQLFNVLKGDMNLVGPRPEQPEIFEELRKTIPVYQQRQLVRPGITGWAQVNHRYDSSIDDVRKKLHYDLEYVRRRSVSKDVMIMAKTPSVMLFRHGAQ